MAIFRRNRPAGGPAGPHGQPGGPGGHSDVRHMLLGAPAERVRQDLRLTVTRVGPHMAPPALAWPVTDEIAAVACVRLPDGAIVTAEIPMAQAWGMGAEDIWLQSATNLRGEHFSRSEFDTAAGVPMTMFTGQAWPGAAQLTRLGEALGEDLPAGALVTLPEENTLLTIPIHNPRVIDMVGHMFATGHELTRGQPPMSARPLWWHEGVIEPLDVQWHGQTGHVSGSPRFTQTMAAAPQR
ncbi:hypothetical protein LO772_04415 [Yinghuangia sp. ASG 101]|uniref:hypothetical protein n=1 Tax=Yinghuangia sp. ASG 101 TaxID=2896848 RepID=UPI001E361E0B|nr:hypothetical protein [Yinghuangia sp. ASG 101]UGQ12870.1 hypothetical protein LO772_04415 [Yinghuangia sp. ASG 101]